MFYDFWLDLELNHFYFARYGSILFAILATKVHYQMRKQTAFVVNGGKVINQNISKFYFNISSAVC